MLSPRSNANEIAIPENYSFPLFENFEKGSLRANYWTVDKEYGDESDTEWLVAAQVGHNASMGLSYWRMYIPPLLVKCRKPSD